jgi:hypothetical protein
MSTHPRYLRILSLLVTFLFLDASLLSAQGVSQPAQGGLTITILEGDDAIMNTRQRVNREAIVQVDDENHKPVGGAMVTFLAPHDGPSATFLNGARNITVVTDEQGRAVLRGITPNKAAGKFQIRVTAAKDGRVGNATINQTNALPAGAAAAGGGLSTKAIIGIAAAAGAAVAIGVAVALSGGGKSTPASVPIVLQPGTPGVGPPH